MADAHEPISQNSLGLNVARLGAAGWAAILIVLASAQEGGWVAAFTRRQGIMDWPSEVAQGVSVAIVALIASTITLLLASMRRRRWFNPIYWLILAPGLASFAFLVVILWFIATVTWRWGGGTFP